MLLTKKKKGVSQNCQTPSIIGICSYCVLDRPVFERCQTLLHPELTLWWSFLLADGAHHKKPHSPTHPMTNDQVQQITVIWLFHSESFCGTLFSTSAKWKSKTHLHHQHIKAWKTWSLDAKQCSEISFQVWYLIKISCWRQYVCTA